MGERPRCGQLSTVRFPGTPILGVGPPSGQISTSTPGPNTSFLHSVRCSVRMALQHHLAVAELLAQWEASVWGHMAAPRVRDPPPFPRCELPGLGLPPLLCGPCQACVCLHPLPAVRSRGLSFISCVPHLHGCWPPGRLAHCSSRGSAVMDRDWFPGSPVLLETPRHEHTGSSVPELPPVSATFCCGVLLGPPKSSGAPSPLRMELLHGGTSASGPRLSFSLVLCWGIEGVLKWGLSLEGGAPAPVVSALSRGCRYPGPVVPPPDLVLSSLDLSCSPLEGLRPHLPRLGLLSPWHLASDSCRTSCCQSVPLLGVSPPH